MSDSSANFPENSPQRPENRPGLSQLAYRIGDYSSVRQRLLARLPKTFQFPRPESSESSLADLTTRSDDDFAISLLDAWAVVTDVLTFYQERIANEGYLLTATERRSVLELARSIGYELDPGVAASTHLSFTVEDAPGSPTEVTIPQGTQIMSVPEKDELPQTFETLEDFTAYLVWNAIKPRPHRPQIIDETTDQLYLEGTNTQLKQEDLLLIVDQTPKSIPYVVQLTEVIEDSDTDYTLVRWQLSSPKQQSWSKIEGLLQNPQVLTFRQTAHLFGYNAPDWEIMPAETKLEAIEESGGAIQGGVFRSVDNGIIWEAISQGLPNSDILCLVARGQLLFAGTPDKGIFRSLDNGMTWSAANEGVTSQNILALHMAALGGGFNGAIFAGTPNGGVFRSKDQGNNWVAINTGSVRVENQGEDNWQSVNTSLPNTVVRSLLTYTAMSNRGFGTIYTEGTTVYGENTSFLNEFSPGDQIAVFKPDGPRRTIDNIVAVNHLVVNGEFGLPRETAFTATSEIKSTWTVNNFQSAVINLFSSLTEFFGNEAFTLFPSIVDSFELVEQTETVTLKTGSSGSNIDIQFTISSNSLMPGVTGNNNLVIPSIFFLPQVSSQGTTVTGSGFVIQIVSGILTPVPVSTGIGGFFRQFNATPVSETIGKNKRVIREIRVNGQTREIEDDGFSADDRVTIRSPFDIDLNQANSFELIVRVTSNIISSQSKFKLEEKITFRSGLPASTITIQLTPLLETLGEISGVIGGVYSDRKHIFGVNTQFKKLSGTEYTLPDATVHSMNIEVLNAEGSDQESQTIIRVISDEELEIDSFFIRDLPRETRFFLLDSNGEPRQFERHYLFAGTDEGVYLTVDHGKNWNSRNLVERAIYSLHHLADHIVLAGTDIGVFYSENDGESWIDTNLVNETVLSFTSYLQEQVNPPDNQVFASTDNGVWRSINQGHGWSVINDNALVAGTLTDALTTYQRGNVRYLFAATNRGIFVSENSDADDDVAVSWQFVSKALATQSTTALAFSQATKSLFVGTQFKGFLETESATDNTAEPQVKPQSIKLEWPDFQIRNSRQLDFDTLSPRILPESWVLLASDRNPNNPEQETDLKVSAHQIDDIAAIDRRDFGLSGKITRTALTTAIDNSETFGLRSTHVLVQSEPLALVPEPLTVPDQKQAIFNDPIKSDTVFLAELVSNLQTEQPVIVSGQHIRAQLADVGGVLKQQYQWESRHENLRNLVINTLTTDASFVGTDEGLYHWNNSNQWKALSALDYKVIHSVWQSDDDQNTLFVGADQKLYRSINGGVTWQVLSDLPEISVQAIFDYLVPEQTTQTNINAINGLELTLDDNAIDRLNIGDVITIKDTITGADKLPDQVRVVTSIDNSNQTITINEVFDPTFPLEDDSAASRPFLTIGGRLLWAGTRKGLYRSTDSGNTWQSIPQFLDLTIYDLDIVTRTGQPQLLIATNEGLYRSGSGNEMWENNAVLPDETLSLLVSDQAIWAGTSQGIYSSRNNWSKVPGLGYRRILSLTQRDRVLFAGTDQGIYRSQDNGSTWQSIDVGLRPSAGRALAVVDKKLIVGTEQGLFETPNNGDVKDPLLWGRSNDGLENSQVLSLAVSTSGTEMIAGTTAGAFYSTNAGRSWIPSSDGLSASTSPDPLAVSSILFEFNHWYVGTPEGLFCRQPDKTQWQEQHTGLAYKNIRALARASAESLWVGTQDGGLLKFTPDFNNDNASGTWSQTSLNNVAVQAIAVGSAHIFVGTQQDGLYRSSNNGSTWDTITETRAGQGTISTKGVQATVVGANFGDFLQAGDVINAGGQSRTIVSEPANDGDNSFLLDLPFKPDLASNTGFTINTGLTNRQITAVAIETNSTNTIYVGTAGSGVFRSTDDGDHWDQVIINLDDLEIRCLWADNDQDIWAGTAQRGIFRSINGGDLWAPVSTDLTNTDIRAILRPNASSALIVGGIGILIADDGLTTTPVQRDDIIHVLKAPQKILNQQINEPLTYYWRWSVRDKDNNRGIFDTPYQQPFPLLPAHPDDAPVSERAIIQVPSSDQKRPVMIFKEPLTYSYDPTTVEIYANVVEATHGETEAEVLGSGDGNASFQEFVLKKPPLTYVPAANASGSESSLAVRVDGVLWQEVLSLYPLTPQEQSYIIRIEDDGTTRIGFGDGIRGARLPSGLENITATYRSGIGTEGNVAARQLNILKTRPQGITDVLNPLPATGAANPERLEDARVKAPPTVRTLDRIVSLQDFEDFAQGFAGIGKAQAAAIWNGVTEVVHITLAGIQGAAVLEDSLLYRQLFQAIEQARDPMQQVILAAYDQQLFNVEARVLIDPRYEAEPVLAAAKAALQTKFQFDTQAFGQAVTSSEVITVIQSIDGIVAVDLDALYRVGESRELASTLTAAPARYDQVSRQLQPAQLLLLNGVGVQLSGVASL